VPIDREAVKRIVGYNKRDIDGLKETLDRKLISFIGWLYRNLELGPAWERRLRARLAGRIVPEIVEALRDLAGRLSDVVRAGRASARGYASMVVREHDASEEIKSLDTKLPKIADDLGYFKAAVSLKRYEADFADDLYRHLLAFLPTDRRGIAEAERVLLLIKKRLVDLLKMVGSLEGRVFNADTKEPIEGAEVELIPLVGGTALSAVTDKYGYYRIDFIPPGSYGGSCRAEGYGEAEDTFAIEAGKIKIKDWYLEPIPVPRVWSYALRVSCRVVRAYAPGRAKRAAAFPPRKVTLDEWLPEVIEEKKKPRGEVLKVLKMGYPETKRKIKEIKLKSPLFVELFFEDFVSSLSRSKLEAEYKNKLVNLIKEHEKEIVEHCKMVKVTLDEFDFGIESGKPIEFTKEESEDFYEIWVYPPSGYAQLAADGHYKHKV